jgi:hypothetical protein
MPDGAQCNTVQRSAGGDCRAGSCNLQDADSPRAWKDEKLARRIFVALHFIMMVLSRAVWWIMGCAERRSSARRKQKAGASEESP